MAIKETTTVAPRRKTKTSTDSERCRYCKQIKPLGEFRQASANKTGRSRTCHSCADIKKQEKLKDQPRTKQCYRCHIQLELLHKRRCCANCLSINNTQQKRRHESRIRRGLCQHCGSRPPFDGKYSCVTCLEKMCARVKKGKLKRIESGLCYHCSNPAVITRKSQTNSEETSTKVCEDCYFKCAANSNFGRRAGWESLKDKWHIQGGICPYTGVVLILGETASVDHIKPRSRFPELSESIDNIEWIHERVNGMKRDMTKEEFLALIKQIINNLSL